MGRKAKKRQRSFAVVFDLFLVLLLLAIVGSGFLSGGASLSLNDYSELTAEANSATNDLQVRASGVWVTTENTAAQGDTPAAALTLSNLTTFGRDTFTDPDATQLRNHIPDVGTGWTTSTNSIDIRSNTAGLKINTGTKQVGREMTNLGNDDMNVTATLNIVVADCRGVNQYAGIVARLSPSNFNNHYLVTLEDQCPSQVGLYKVVGGVKTQLGASYSLAGGQLSATVRLELYNNSQRVFVDGTQRITTSEPDTTLQGNNFAGVAFSDTRKNRPATDDFLSGTLPVREELTYNPHMATTSGHYIYQVEVRARSTAPPNTTYKVSLLLNGNLVDDLYVKTDASPASNQVLYAQFDIGTTINRNALYSIDVQQV